MRPYDPQCKRYPHEIQEYVDALEDDIEDGGNPQRTVEDFVIMEEGTYNPENGHFLCTECYIRFGMPSSPVGWRCP